LSLFGLQFLFPFLLPFKLSFLSIWNIKLKLLPTSSKFLWFSCFPGQLQVSRTSFCFYAPQTETKKTHSRVWTCSDETRLRPSSWDFQLSSCRPGKSGFYSSTKSFY
jgi:hypothetical protein